MKDNNLSEINNDMKPLRRIRSFVRRNSRLTEAQKNAYKIGWVQFGLSATQIFNPENIFGRIAPLALEIGFGSGQSLLALATQQPDWDFIGIEMYQSGIGAVLKGIQMAELNNIRIYEADAVDVLQQCIPNESLLRIQIFFPDPWQKRKHHPRRLIQPDFVKLLSTKLMCGGQLHLATDWEDYAEDMLRVLQAEKSLKNLNEAQGFSKIRSSQRPIVTKFEGRALKEGRKIAELQYEKIEIDNLLGS